MELDMYIPFAEGGAVVLGPSTTGSTGNTKGSSAVTSTTKQAYTRNCNIALLKHTQIIAVCWGKAYQPEHRISYTIARAPSEASDQTAHPRSLIRVFAWHTVDSHGCKTSSSRQRSSWSGCADDLSLRWAQFQSCGACCSPLILYSRTSLSRTRLFRITAYLEVKIWSLF